MCTHDDFHGVYFSIQSLRLHHIGQRNDVELIVIDNNPTGAHSEAIKGLKNWIPSLRYIPQSSNTGTSSRNLIFSESRGKYTISMDCHVLFPTGSIDSLLQYYAENPDSRDLIQGPMMYDNLVGYSTHFKPTWGGDMFGQWDANKEGYESGKPFEIPMHGLGVFSCKTDNWLGFNPLFTGFGGEEGYIHEKFRKAGAKALCLPQFKWLHRFGRPDGVKYPLVLEDRVWNYFVGWLELTQDPAHPMVQQIYDNFKNRIPLASINNIFHRAKEEVLNNKIGVST